MAHSNTAATAGALDGVLVLDLSRILAGPSATQLLGDLGATVIKIENPGTSGDDTRTWGPPYVDTTDGASDLSAYFIAANRNKFSVAADLSTADGQDLVRGIAAQAQVVVENYKPGGLAKYGLDYATLSAINPALVYCSITGFGQTGPNKSRPGYDVMAQGFGGIMALTGEPDGTPVKVGVGIADVMCGMYASIGILAALRHAENTGQGQQIDLALVDSQMAWLVNEGTNYLTSKVNPTRRGNGHPNIVPYNAFPTKDGHIILAVGNDAQFQAFCRAMDRTDLATDSRFQTNPLRIQNRTEMDAAVIETFRTRESANILSILQSARVPCGPINTVEQALTSDQAQARGSVVNMTDETTTDGSLDVLANPLKFSKTPVKYTKSPPRFGADTDNLSIILDQHRTSSAKP
jgi:formyl-CoA transferase